MKRNQCIVVGGTILMAGLIVFVMRKPSVHAFTPKESHAAPLRHSPSPSQPLEEKPSAENQATIGTLWEPGATAHEAKRTSIPIEANSFDAARGAAVGDKLAFRLSARIKPLEGTVTNAAVSEDGTSVVHIQIAGSPAGELILQENENVGFFLGQLYYKELPIAYQFKKSAGTLTAERHLVSDLVCSSVAANGSVEMGLPASTAQAAKTTASASTVTAALSNGAVPETNTGSKNILFALNLSSKLSKPAVFTYSVSSGTATVGSDLPATSGSVSLTKTAVITIPITPDYDPEADESFTLTVTNPTYGTYTATGTILNDDGLIPSAVPILNSLPEATACAYLDFDGQVVKGTTWNGGGTITAAPPILTTAQVQEIWKRVSEDYAPFQINITTDAAVYAAAAPTHRIRCIVTPTYSWYGSAGGVAYVGSFTWPGDTPCWVFSSLLSNSPSYIAEAASHEIGHTLGLSHDGTATLTYYAGQGTGGTSWAPIMGVGYDRKVVQWSKGEYAGANNKEDDLAIIAGANGFSYREDDHGNTPETATPLTGKTPTATGIISTRTDIDEFSFKTAGGKTAFTITGASPSGNLDIQARIVNSSGVTVGSSNPSGALNASLSVSLAAGNYYLIIDGVGEGEPFKTGYSDYDSLGAYSITGSVP